MMNNNPVQITRNPAQTKIEPYEIGDTIVLSKEEIQMFDSVAEILEYPTLEWPVRLEKAIEMTGTTGLDGSALLTEFKSGSDPLNLTELQELYTRTFDLNPVCALEIGYHLFGEDYKRGEFLAKMRESENPYQLGQERQLPDFLPVVLRLLGKMDDAELRASLIGYCMLPAFKKMNTAFDKGENPYGRIILFLTKVLKQIADNSLAAESAEARYQYA